MNFAIEDLRQRPSINSFLIANMFAKDPEEYKRNFFPFPLDQEVIFQRLIHAKNDMYWTIDFRAFFMLRGWDEGYEVPAFGVYVSQHSQDKGLATLALDYALSYCKLYRSETKTMMLKVAHDNPAKRIYEKAGFYEKGTCEKTGHIIMHKNL